MSKDTGGPAFPVSYDHQTFEPSHVDEAKRLMSGMTLRDYFAAKCVAAMVSTISDEDGYGRAVHHASSKGLNVSQWFSRESYKQADAMISERAQASSGWIKCEDAKPADGQTVVVWRKWPNWNCFAAEVDCWQADSSDAEGGAWCEAEESCQHIETCADGPGEVQRPITTHWHPLPADPTE